MIRPVDWHPLAEVDPLPGDPDAITVESTRLARLGDDMRTQAARLRQIGADTTLVGAYAEELRSAAGELAQDLDKVSGRYERVASALKNWAPELATAQAETLKARAKALEADQIRAAHSDAPAWGREWQFLQLVPSATGPQLAEAHQMFAEAQRMLRDTLVHAQARGSHYANLIDDANDIFKDSGWDNVKDWADRNADWIDQWSNGLGWVATAAAIGAIFIPGVNVVAFGYLATALTTTAMAATAVAASGHLVLASSGNGSWVDVAFDVVALATLGMGLRAARGLEKAHQATRLVASQKAGESASEAVIRTRWADLERATQQVVRARTPAARENALRLAAEIREEAALAGAEAARLVMRAPLPESRLAARLTLGERELASQWDDVLAIHARYPNSHAIAENFERAAESYHLARASFLTATAGDLLNRTMQSPASRWPFARTGSSW